MVGLLIWAGLLLLVAGIWGSRHWEVSRAQRELPPLTEDPHAEPLAQPPLVSVLIAAKDEEANIEAAVRTMLGQDYPNFELIVVNDRSTDRTAGILESLRSEQPNGRLRVLHIDQLTEGWFGKNNAMREGLAQSRGEWLCFADADCRQTSSRSLSTAVRYALDHRVDFLSVLPQFEMHGIWERIIQPVAGAVMVFWFHPKRVNDPANAAAYANGAFMLMSRRCYEAIGGHEAVRSQVNEDMHMARLAKENGQRLFVIQSDGLYKVRMYDGFRQTWRGWSRIFYGCFGTFRRLRISMGMLIVTNVFPYASLLISLVMLAVRGWPGAGLGWQCVAGASALAVVLQQSLLMRFYRLCRVNPAWAPTFIVGAVICIGMLLAAMFKLRANAATTWRGTTYRHGQFAQAP